LRTGGQLSYHQLCKMSFELVKLPAATYAVAVHVKKGQRVGGMA